jgi:hypothetical protein
LPPSLIHQYNGNALRGSDYPREGRGQWGFGAPFDQKVA